MWVFSTTHLRTGASAQRILPVQESCESSTQLFPQYSKVLVPVRKCPPSTRIKNMVFPARDCSPNVVRPVLVPGQGLAGTEQVVVAGPGCCNSLV